MSRAEIYDIENKIQRVQGDHINGPINESTMYQGQISQHGGVSRLLSHLECLGTQTCDITSEDTLTKYTSALPSVIYLNSRSFLPTSHRYLIPAIYNLYSLLELQIASCRKMPVVFKTFLDPYAWHRVRIRWYIYDIKRRLFSIFFFCGVVRNETDA